MRRMMGASAFLLVAFATGVHAAPIDGQWARGDGNAKVRIAACGKNICAVNTWIKPGPDGVYAGDAFDPQRDLTYRITVTVNGDRMTTKGCVIAGLLCKGVDWTRIH